MALLGADEILGHAVRIEENGEVFYRQWANKTEDKNQKKLFHFLADEEKEHKKAFMRLLEELKAANLQPQGVDNEAYREHLESFTQEIFPPGPQEKEMQEVIDLNSALKFALQQEAVSVLFYTDLKNYVPKEYVEVMQHIINEERKHIADLEELQEKLRQHGLR
jgi:rubrerythrin